MSPATPCSCGVERRGGTNRRPLCRRLLALLCAGATAATAFGWEDRHGAWSPHGDRIAFSSDRDGRFHLYVAAVDGSGLRQLTSGDCDDHAPAWAPDGLGLYCDSDREGNRDLFFVPLDGGSPRRVFAATPYTNRTPVPSPDGTALLFESSRERDGLARLYFSANQGRDVWLLTDTPFASLQPAWAPAGRRIVFRQRENLFAVTAELWVINENGTAPLRLTKLGTSASQPAWSSDGRRVVFAAVADGNNEIFSIAYDGTDLQRLTRDPADDGRPRYSPDGRQVLFTSNRGGAVRLHLMQSDGAKVRPWFPAETVAR